MKLLTTLFLYGIILLYYTYVSHENCICPKSWTLNVTHHEFCGKELSGESCIESARYNCTKGIANALFWDDCKEIYYKEFCTPKTNKSCRYNEHQAARKTICLAQRACKTKPHADKMMMEVYGKTSLLTNKP
jgi:hypothetical protein